MNKYELMFIVRSDLEDSVIKNTSEDLKRVLTDGDAEILEETDMGKRELAYEINKMKTGHYFLYVVKASNEVIDEFNRISRINENVIRNLTIKVED